VSQHSFDEGVCLCECMCECVSVSVYMPLCMCCVCVCVDVFFLEWECVFRSVFTCFRSLAFSLSLSLLRIR
jgi:hypothetical protein